MITKTIENITIYEQELNLERSKEVYQFCQSYLKKKECYANAFYVMSHYMDSFKKRGWRIAYGYFMTLDNLFFRHCYIVDNEGNVIDPTYLLTRSDDTEELPIYWTFALLDIDEYLSLLEKYDNRPDFLKHYQDTHRTLFKWGLEQEPSIMFLDY